MTHHTFSRYSIVHLLVFCVLYAVPAYGSDTDATVARAPESSAGSVVASSSATPILSRALEAVDAFTRRTDGGLRYQTSYTAGEISSKRTMGLVKIIIGSVAGISGVGYIAGGSTVATIDGAGGLAASAIVVGTALGGGGAWLIWSGVKDRAEAADMEAEASADFSFTPVRGGAAVGFRRAW